jgi:hypothetical protein
MVMIRVVYSGTSSEIPEKVIEHETLVLPVGRRGDDDTEETTPGISLVRLREAVNLAKAEINEYITEKMEKCVDQLTELVEDEYEDDS